MKKIIIAEVTPGIYKVATLSNVASNGSASISFTWVISYENETGEISSLPKSYEAAEIENFKIDDNGNVSFNIKQIA